MKKSEICVAEWRAWLVRSLHVFLTSYALFNVL